MTRIGKPRLHLAQVKRRILRLTICTAVGHYSTGTLLWWMCDRCHADFTRTALPSQYIDDTKITRSRPLVSATIGSPAPRHPLG